MVLFIDTTDNQHLCLALYNRKKWLKAEPSSPHCQITMIFPSVDSLLSRAKIQKKNLSQIFINPGPGSYTSTRIGITFANTLGLILNIPVISSPILPDKKMLLKNRQKKFSKPVYPQYNANLS